MNVKKLLRSILLFPAMLVLGIPEGLEAAAVAEISDADPEGDQNEEKEGAEAPADEVDPDADQEEGAEAETAEKETEAPKGIKQKSLEERVTELADKRFAEHQAKIENAAKERLEADQKPFIELSAEQTDKLNENYVDAVARKGDLLEAIRLGDRSPETIVELRKAEKWILETETWYADNEAKKAEWTAKQGDTAKQQAESLERSTRLATTAEVFREAKSIPQDAWDEAARWFNEQLAADKVLSLKFADAYRLKGDVAAVEFAHDYCTEHMGKGAEDALKQKLEAKTKLAPGITGKGVTPEGPDLGKLLKTAQKSGTEEDYLAYVEAKRGQRK